MSLIASSGRTWDEATSPAATRVARRFEADWRASPRGRRPDPADYIPEDDSQRPGALLALARADLALRYEAREPVRVEEYPERFPELGSDGLVALVYEEFCLREEAGERPDPSAYYRRFPELSDPLRRVLDIHDLVGSGGTASSSGLGPPPAEPTVPFPENGETIAGFRLVGELGRGTFGRVFLAEERQLADRPVALKVTRAGSREPRTLARLQHTHIVPVYSYRTDPATGLHLLCMPFLGRVTLAQVLADPSARVARFGADLVAALDRLGEGGAGESEPGADSRAGRSTARLALSKRSYAAALAWWGARLAEALQHAHDRGVLHRDVKPSNVLLTGDAMPMLLDFNLAHEPRLDDPEAPPSIPGGTMAYMSPEHLESLSGAKPDLVDARSDVYSLGVVLYEALATSRPFPHPAGALTVGEALRMAVAERREGAPLLRLEHPEVPPALEAVVARCLEADPDRRYNSAAELAADLQAVADDGPLRFAREPEPSRTLRWVRRRRRPLAALAAVTIGLTVINLFWSEARIAQQMFRAGVAGRIEEARRALADKDFDTASRVSSEAEEQAEAHDFRELKAEAGGLREKAGRRRAAYRVADDFFAKAEPLRLGLIGSSADIVRSMSDLKSALIPLGDLIPLRPGVAVPRIAAELDVKTRDRLRHEAEELMFFFVVAQEPYRNPDLADLALDYCKVALRPSAGPGAWPEDPGPWRAVRARVAAGMDQGAVVPAADGAEPPRRLEDTPPARTCLKWAMVSRLEGRRGWAKDWLRQAVRRDSGHYWSHNYLAYLHLEDGEDDLALREYDVAIALGPGNPWTLLNRGALLHRKMRLWGEAADDLKQAVRIAAEDLKLNLVAARTELGLIDLALGNVAGARENFENVRASAPRTPLARAARLNLAFLDLEAGELDKAREAYESLIEEDPADGSARLGRAQLALRRGRPEQADADLTRLIDDDKAGRRPGARGPAALADLLALRARARVLTGRVDEALADADAALRLSGSPGDERLLSAVRVVSGRAEDLRLEDPGDVALWPLSGPLLAASLRAAAGRLEGRAGSPDPAEALPARLTRAILLSAAGESAAAVDEAGRAVGLAPASAHAHLVRARVRRRAGDLAGAAADVEHGLNLEPGSPRLLEFRGVLRTEAGAPLGGVADLSLAIHRGAGGPAYAARAEARMALGGSKELSEAVRDWTRALQYDPENPRTILGRARAFLRLGQTDQALADLEQVVAWTEDPGLLGRAALAYASILTERPDRLPRARALARRATAGFLAGVLSRPDFTGADAPRSIRVIR